MLFSSLLIKNTSIFRGFRFVVVILQLFLCHERKYGSIFRRSSGGLPAVDDEFAQEVSEFDTLDEYKADIKAKLLKEKEDEAARAKEDAVIGKIIEGAKMEIPDAMVEYQTRQMLDEFAQRIQSQGISLDQYFQFTGLTEEKYMEEMKPRALQNIQSRLVLEAVAQAENLVAEEADKIKELLGERQMEEMKKDIAVQKAAKLVAEAAVEA